MERREDLGIINFLLVMRNFSLNSHVFHTVDSFEFIRRNVKQKKGPFTATEQHIINIIKENPTLWQEAIAQIVAEIPDMWSDKSPDVVQNEPFPTGSSAIPKDDHSLVSPFQQFSVKQSGSPVDRLGLGKNETNVPDVIEIDPVEPTEELILPKRKLKRSKPLTKFPPTTSPKKTQFSEFSDSSKGINIIFF